jgi:hypothetical protein
MGENEMDGWERRGSFFGERASVFFFLTPPAKWECGGSRARDRVLGASHRRLRSLTPAFSRHPSFGALRQGVKRLVRPLAGPP